MSNWTSFGASIVGGLVAATAALGAVALGQRHENRRATRLDQQRLRDAKAERLRRLYEPFVEFSMLLRQVATEKSFIREGDTEADRDARHQQQFADGMREVSSVIAAAIIEPGTTDVRAAYEATYLACDRYLRSLSMNKIVAGTTGLDEQNKQFDAIIKAAEKLQAVVQSQLSDLEKSI